VPNVGAPADTVAEPLAMRRRRARPPNAATRTRDDSGTRIHEFPNANLSGGGASGDITWPAVKVASNGYVYALFANPISDSIGTKIGTTLNLYRSTDHGATWQKQDVTPANPGLIRYSRMHVAGDGHTVGVRLDVVYTRCTDLVPGDDTTDCLNSDIYFARSL
jgi:hypothetical protein